MAPAVAGHSRLARRISRLFRRRSPLSFESKYVAPGHHAATILARLAACCRADAEHPMAEVHSVYFDSRELVAMAECDNGDYRKAKVRLRWYVTDGVASEPFLECKRKQGSQRRKARLPVPGLRTALGLEHPSWLAVPQRLRGGADLPPQGLLQPTLHLAYRRHRFIEPVTGMRLALDDRIRLVRAHPRHSRAVSRPTRELVFEVKGEQRELPATLRFLRGLGARRAAFSKYALFGDLLT